MQRAVAAVAIGLLLLGVATPSLAGSLSVGAGSTLDLGTGSLDLGCADLDVAGTLTAGTQGFTSARDVAIQPGGTLNANSATLTLAGDWDNAGTFNRGTSTLQMTDGCALLGGVVTGNTTFANLSINTTSAKQVNFTAGSTQSVTGQLSLFGAVGNLLQLRSTVNGSAAFLNVTGGSSVNFLDVDDINATPGNDIAVGYNSVKGPNTPGWLFGVAVPMLGPLALLALALVLGATGRRWLPRPSPGDSTS
jgi:hypothetical protein